MIEENKEKIHVKKLFKHLVLSNYLSKTQFISKEDQDFRMKIALEFIPFIAKNTEL